MMIDTSNSYKYRWTPAVVLFLFTLALARAWAAPATTPTATHAATPIATHGSAIVSAHPDASHAGRIILEAGGNAFDAAVAVSAALAVVEPASSGLGGGGFWLLHRQANKHHPQHEVFIDGRERAPLAAHQALFLDASGVPIPRISMDGPLAAAIPGVPRALAHIAKHYGKLPLADTLKPAIRLAKEGFSVTPRYLKLASFRLQVLRGYPSTRTIFLDNGELPKLGQVIKQPELATTLSAIATHGADAFYTGERAQRMIKAVVAAGGIWSMQDLKNYRVIEREPIIANIAGMRIVSAPPPSSGGIALVSILNMLSILELNTRDPITRTHLIAEAMRRAYRDRAAYLGDPDFVTIPVATLSSHAYAVTLAGSISKTHATPSTELAPLEPYEQGTDTTHFSILDNMGNRVAATLSINYPFGSGFVVPGTGVLLNDEMDDFSARPMTPNAYGLVGIAANAIAPGKRPLSSMTPTFLEQDGRIAILGTPGGSRIITMVLLAALDFSAGNGPRSWVVVPRFHHQYLPDEIQFERGALRDLDKTGLARMGHRVRELKRRYGNMQAIEWNKTTGAVRGASDPRGEGTALVW